MTQSFGRVINVSNLPTGGNLVAASAFSASRVTVFTIRVNQTTAGQTMTLPTPPSDAAIPLRVTVMNPGTANFTMYGFTIPASVMSQAAEFMWDGSTWALSVALSGSVTSVNGATGAVSGILTSANNLSDVGSRATARANMGIDQRTAVADANYTVLATDYFIAYTSITAARTISLPAASTYAPGRRLVIKDESGSASATLTISLSPNGTDLLNGSNTTQVGINNGRGRVELESNGTNAWTIPVRSVTGDVTGSGFGSSIALTIASAAVTLGKIASGAVSFSNMATAALATAAQFLSNTASLLLTTDNVWSAAAYVTLTDATTIAVDMNTFINAKVTLGGNRTLGAPTNTKPGQSGSIIITQDATGSRTLAYNAVWKFPYGVTPVLTTTAAAVDRLDYLVVDSTHIHANITNGVA